MDKLLPDFIIENEGYLLNYSTTAIISTSTRTLFGSCLTATQERAGLLVKYFSYKIQLLPVLLVLINLKDSVQITSQELNLSKNTVYLHLRNLEKGN